MKKKNGKWRNGLFYLIGIVIYSLFFWITGSYAQVFGMILIALVCNILYKMDHKMPPEKEWIKTKDIIYMCVGAVFSSLSGGFPFSMLSSFH